jgi:hypothetical protein
MFGKKAALFGDPHREINCADGRAVAKPLVILSGGSFRQKATEQQCKQEQFKFQRT